jgi:predicted dehydrogenase
MVAIVGSGFGLYGYLPALIKNCGQRVLLPKRYRDRFFSRVELKSFYDMIDWENDEYEVINAAHIVVIAQRPADQFHWVNFCLEKDNIERLILEKPLAQNPMDSYHLLDRLEKSKKHFRIGYNFRYTKWGIDLINRIKQKENITTISIEWRFCAYHYSQNLNNWKRYDSLGGGALRFYGIHLIALLAEMGYNKIIASKIYKKAINEAESWSATVSGINLPIFHVFIDSNSVNEYFSIKVSNKLQNHDMQLSLQNPFALEESDSNNLDYRVGILSSVCQDAIYSKEYYLPWYKNSIDLWDMTEKNI